MVTTVQVGLSAALVYTPCFAVSSTTEAADPDPAAPTVVFGLRAQPAFPAPCVKATQHGCAKVVLVRVAHVLHLEEGDAATKQALCANS